jgi:hypothetical protein
MAPFSSFSTRGLILTEIQDTLMANGLVLALCIRPYEEREASTSLRASAQTILVTTIQRSRKVKSLLEWRLWLRVEG